MLARRQQAVISQAGQQRDIVHAHALSVIKQEPHEVGTFDGLPGAADALGLNGIVGVAQAGGVDQGDRQAIEGEVFTQHITGGAGHLGDDGCINPGQLVEQGRLADIGRAAEHDLQALLQHPPALRVDGQLPQRLGQARQPVVQVGIGQPVDILVGEIECALDEHARRDQAFGQRCDACGKAPFQRLERSLGGACRAGIDQIDDGFGLRQIELAIDKSALRELTGPGNAGTEDAGRAQQAIKCGGAAVALQFDHILAGERGGRREAQHQAPVERLAIGIAKSAQHRRAGRRQRVVG